MGCFDSFVDKVKCPHCGEEQEVEIQTKDFDCCLSCWHGYDLVSEEMTTSFTDSYQCNKCSKDVEL